MTPEEVAVERILNAGFMDSDPRIDTFDLRNKIHKWVKAVRVEAIAAAKERYSKFAMSYATSIREPLPYVIAAAIQKDQPDEPS